MVDRETGYHCNSSLCTSKCRETFKRPREIYLNTSFLKTSKQFIKLKTEPVPTTDTYVSVS